MAMNTNQKVVGGLGLIAALALLMGAKGMEDEAPDRKDLPPPPPDDGEDKKVMPDDEPKPEDDIPQDPTPSEILIPLVRNTPIPGTFYDMSADPGASNFSQVVREALDAAVPGAGDSKEARIAMQKCMSSSKWNRNLYGAKYDFASWTSPDDIYIGRAWMPWHDNAIEAMLDRQVPTRAVKMDGGKVSGVGSNYGLLWIPLVDKDRLMNFGTPGCATLVREDGTSGLMPPKELLDMIGWND